MASSDLQVSMLMQTFREVQAYLLFFLLEAAPEVSRDLKVHEICEGTWNSAHPSRDQWLLLAAAHRCSLVGLN